MLTALVLSQQVYFAAATAPEPPLPPPSPVVWADMRDGKLELDVTSDAGYPIDKLFETLTAKYKKGEAGMFDVQPEDAPEFLKGKTEVTVITSGGVKKATLGRIELSLGASATHLYARVDGVSAHHALVAIDATFAKTARLRDATEAAAAKGPPALAAKVFAMITKSLTVKTRKALTSSRIGPTALHFVGGAFPQKARWLVWIDEPVGARDQQDFEHFVYAALVGDDGKEVFVFQEPIVSAETWWRPLYLVDFDGDGVDELIGQPYYYEGLSVALYRWRGGKYEAFTMTGDGA